MLGKLDNIEDQKRIIEDITRDFSEPHYDKDIPDYTRDMNDLREQKSLFHHVDNVRFLYMTNYFKDCHGNKYFKDIPSWFVDKYVHLFDRSIENKYHTTKL